jgi:hypothetical protein
MTYYLRVVTLHPPSIPARILRACGVSGISDDWWLSSHHHLECYRKFSYQTIASQRETNISPGPLRKRRPHDVTGGRDLSYAPAIAVLLTRARGDGRALSCPPLTPRPPCSQTPISAILILISKSAYNATDRLNWAITGFSPLPETSFLPLPPPPSPRGAPAMTTRAHGAPPHPRPVSRVVQLPARRAPDVNNSPRRNRATPRAQTPSIHSPSSQDPMFLPRIMAMLKIFPTTNADFSLSASRAPSGPLPPTSPPARKPRLSLLGPSIPQALTQRCVHS